MNKDFIPDHEKIQNLKSNLRAGKVVLFVGAGVSASVKLPTWSQLIENMAEQLGYDSQVFSLYGDNLALAEYCEINNHMPEIKQWMRKNWSINEDTIRKSIIHQEIVDLGCKTIYTTNYDHCLEMAYKSRTLQSKTIVNIGDLIDCKDDIVQIIKLHGDMNRDDVPLVLSESSYYNRLTLDSPLDIKMRCDMLNKTFLFIGYSMSDLNVRLLFHRLAECWKGFNTRPQSYIFLSKPNPIETDILRERGIEPIIGEYGNKTDSLANFLKQLNDT